LALQDKTGTRLVLVTTDLIGFPRSMSVEIAERVEKVTGLPRANLILSASHTHCGPVITDNLMDIYDMPAEQVPLLQKYRADLTEKLVRVIQDALAELKPATLWQGKATARFAVNRRQATEKGIVLGSNPSGPVDHDVPVLEVRDEANKTMALVFGYACHNTTLQFFQWCGDYAGFAQQYVEERHPGVKAMFWSGCGGDANPLPRGTVELCMKYGKELADAVDAARESGMKPIHGRFTAVYTTIPLPFARIPDREAWAADSLSKNFSVRSRAKRYLALLERGEKIPDNYPHFPIQVWKLGNDIVWVALGGEVVVDYSLRLKRELGNGKSIWVTAYANDVMAYIPSERVLKEGGYEGDTSMIGYGLPSKWAEGIEDRIISTVRKLIASLDNPPMKQD
ncbi:MAG: hypothetical protein NZM31_14580, partial [Gemmatales bacterium]|nr:hypothetical protein [Gemmatales bacterium]MDW8388222.1 hypothetical protein [Gemmatales bacterium]